MSGRRNPQILSRKLPRQARSTDLVAAILEAAIQVLTKEGAPRFTTARVAERAGVSVGSIYQYFPNKASILFRLQSDEWRRTTDLMRGILEDRRKPPLHRMRSLVRAFVRSECDEAQIRMALGDAAPLYRDALEAHEARASTERTMTTFMRDVLPATSAKQRAQVGSLLTTMLGAAGKDFSSLPRTPREIQTYANAVADMFEAYLERVMAR